MLIENKHYEVVGKEIVDWEPPHQYKVNTYFRGWHPEIGGERWQGLTGTETRTTAWVYSPEMSKRQIITLGERLDIKSNGKIK